MKEYLVVEFTINPVEYGREILLASLGLLPYDSFEETPAGLKAYILEEDYKPEELQDLHVFSSGEFEISYETDRLENKNWNEEWETNYEPIAVGNELYIRAPFHDAKDGFKHEIVIMPKMSFGTGHHQTTRLMIRLMREADFKGQQVLDMGTGTGILAIYAVYKGAEKVTAVDNFEWAVENTQENVERNHVAEKVKALHGDAEILSDFTFDTVLANINRNVLLEDMKTYANTLPNRGKLYLSGFFSEDHCFIDEEARSLNFELLDTVTENQWMAACYLKK